MTIGAKIRTQRKMLGLTQTELGQRLGVKTNAVSKWECGRVEDIPMSKVKAMAALFGVPTSYLIDAESERPDHISGLSPMPGFVKKPRLGAIACGKPILAVEEVDQFDSVPDIINCDFTLLCNGDSMINARIFDGDTVYIRSQPEVENGEIAAVRIGDEVTLKKVYRNPGRITLRASNPLFSDLEFEGEALNDIEILGKAVGFTSMIR